VEWRLLSGLSEHEVQRVLQTTRPATYRRGEVLFTAGDVGSTLHLLEAGHVALRVPTVSGEPLTLTIVAPGDAFGELALLRRSSRRSATAVALDDVRTRVLTAEAFRSLVAAHPAVERLLVGILAARVNRLTTHLVESLSLSVDQRIARRLAEVCRVYATPDAKSVVVPLTQEDLAGLAGTTRPTVNAALRKLAEDGVLTLGRGRIEVHDLSRLPTG
jgi:CRP/FNR family transcriptional regulator, cyclic AMP receptor protein